MNGSSNLQADSGAIHELGELRAESVGPILVGDRLLTAQAMTLLIHCDRDIREARSQINQDWYRRLMRIRRRVVMRLQRRWTGVEPPPMVPLGKLRRRYHANLLNYLYRAIG